jgi:hypothetical protein
VKIASERPDLWRAIISVIVLIYMGFIIYASISTLFSQAFYEERPFGYRDALIIGSFVVMAGGWIVRDLIKQIFLFREVRKK